MLVIAVIVAPGGSLRRPRVTGREVGRVAALWRYPVKSMAPEALERVEVGWHGIAGDRRWAFVRADQEHNGFPWLTIRELPALARYQPRLVDPARPDATAVRVRTPAGVELDVAAPALATELGAGVRVMKLDRGAFDTLPLALIRWCSTRSCGPGSRGRTVEILGSRWAWRRERRQRPGLDAHACTGRRGRVRGPC